MQIISADDRLREERGAKILLVGPPGVGKTSLLRTLLGTVKLPDTLFIDIDAGDLSVLDVAVDTIRLDDWQTARDVAVQVAGPNKSFPPTLPYSQTHYESVGGGLQKLDQYKLILVDSLTALTRIAFRYAEQQPEAYSERSGKKDTRGAYGLLAREMILWLNHLQHARAKHVVFVECSSATLTTSMSRHGNSSAKGRRPDVSCLASSIRSSPTNSWISATANRRHAASFVPRLTHGATPPKIAPAGSNKSRNRISENF
jgi:AAA domain